MTTQYWFAKYHDETRVPEIIPHEPVGSCFQKAGPYPTREACAKAVEAREAPCPKCGGVSTGSYYGDTGDLVERTGMCFTCAFWAGHLANPQPGKMVVEGHHFIAKADGEGLRGACGGHYLCLATGDEDTFRNVWHQGKIPPWWKADFPETHVRLK